MEYRVIKIVNPKTFRYVYFPQYKEYDEVFWNFFITVKWWKIRFSNWDDAEFFYHDINNESTTISRRV